jgi:hypothetical protein
VGPLVNHSVDPAGGTRFHRGTVPCLAPAGGTRSRDEREPTGPSTATFSGPFSPSVNGPAHLPGPNVVTLRHHRRSAATPGITRLMRAGERPGVVDTGASLFGMLAPEGEVPVTTVCQGGKSLGSIRHAPPPARTWCGIALTISRGGCLRGRPAGPGRRRGQQRLDQPPLPVGQVVG